MSDQQQYICTRSWARHTEGDIITVWEWRKLPIEVKDSHFEVLDLTSVSSFKDVAIILANVPVLEPLADNILTINDSNVKVNNEPVSEPTPAKEENDIRSIKRHRFQQNTVVAANGNGQEDVPTVHD